MNPTLVLELDLVLIQTKIIAKMMMKGLNLDLQLRKIHDAKTKSIVYTKLK